MKPLVPAYYAQFWVGAGGRRFGVCERGAIPNGIGTSTLRSWRPVLVQRVLPEWFKRTLYETEHKPAMRCDNGALRAE